MSTALRARVGVIRCWPRRRGTGAASSRHTWLGVGAHVQWDEVDAQDAGCCACTWYNLQGCSRAWIGAWGAARRALYLPCAGAHGRTRSAPGCQGLCMAGMAHRSEIAWCPGPTDYASPKASMHPRHTVKLMHAPASRAAAHLPEVERVKEHRVAGQHHSAAGLRKRMQACDTGE